MLISIEVQGLKPIPHVSTRQKVDWETPKHPNAKKDDQITDSDVAIRIFYRPPAGTRTMRDGHAFGAFAMSLV